MSPDTSQVLFRHEYEEELSGWLGRRFAYLCTTYAVLGAVFLVFSLWALLATWKAGGALRLPWLTGAESAAWLAVVSVHFAARRRARGRDDLLRAATRMILLLGAVSLGTRLLAQGLGVSFPGSMILAIFFWHITACLFLPWPPRESLRPVLPLLALWALHALFLGEGAFVARAMAVMFSPGVLVPGLLVCAWRLRRHRQDFSSLMLGRQFTSLRQEFSRARTIHESLFPGPYDDGYVRIAYTYAPMRELGGDFLHLHGGPGGLVNLALVDVTGHGLAAALTVNRLFGELERIRAEAPDASPGEMLSLLNRYIGLTLARHNIFATAVALQLDPYHGRLSWASAGHPPVFLRGINRVVRELASTGLLLGAALDDEYEIGEQSVELSPGDVVVAYTDGAFEARDRGGRALGLRRLREIVEGPIPPHGWPQSICAEVDTHRAGRAEDDVLVASMSFLSYRTKTSAVRPAVASA